LEKDVFPWLEEIPVAEVSAAKTLEVLQCMEQRGVLDTVRRTKGNISQIMDYAVITGKASFNPCPSLSRALQKVHNKHMAALTKPAEVGTLLRAIDEYQGQPEVMAALKLAPLVFVRIGELRTARWVNIDLERAEWRYTVSKTKTEHLVSPWRRKP
jgi:integrase